MPDKAIEHAARVLLPTYLINGRPKTGASHVGLTSASYALLDMINEGNFENMLTDRRVFVTGYRCAVLTMSPARSILATGRFIILQLADCVSGAVLKRVAPLACELLLCAILLLFTANTAQSIERKPEPLVRWAA
jgi:hypothetical protein